MRRRSMASESAAASEVQPGVQPATRLVGALDRIGLRTHGTPLILPDNVLDQPRVELWLSSPERAWYMARRDGVLNWVAVGVLTALIGIGLTIGGSDGTAVQAWGRVICVAAAVLLAWCTVPYWVARRAFTVRRRAMAEYRTDAALSRICADPHTTLSLNGLFELNRRQLDEYQHLTKRQQQLAFRMTWTAAIAGFGVLVACIVLAFLAKKPEQRYLVSGLGALSAGISGYLGKTFYEGHRAAMRQLNVYYREPYMTGRVLAVERLVTQLARTPAVRPFLNDIVAALLQWQLPPVDSEPDDKNNQADAPTTSPKRRAKKTSARPARG